MCDGGGDGGDGGGGGGGDFGGGGDYGESYAGDHHHVHGGNNHCGSQVVGSCLACCTVLFLAVGALLTINSRNNLNELLSTEGTIIDRSSCGDDTWAAVIEYFDDINQATYTFTTTTCSSFKPTVGNSITVLYNPEDPGDAVNGSFVGLWLAPLICFGIGTIACCVAGFFCFRAHASTAGTSSSTGNMDNIDNIVHMNIEGQQQLSPPTTTAPPPSAPPEDTPPVYSNVHVFTHGDGAQYSTSNQYISANNATGTSTSTNPANTSQNDGTTSIFDQLHSKS